MADGHGAWTSHGEGDEATTRGEYELMNRRKNQWIDGNHKEKDHYIGEYLNKLWCGTCYLGWTKCYVTGQLNTNIWNCLEKY
jgi:hypothetical protein